MNHKKIISISVLMGIALIGLILLQLEWIRHDFSLRQERFSQQARVALDNAIDKLETKASVHFITNEMQELLDDSVTAYFRSGGLPSVIDIPEPPRYNSASESRVIDEDTKIEEVDDEGLRTLTFISKSDSSGVEQVKIIRRKAGNDDHFVISVGEEMEHRKEALEIAGRELEQAKEEQKALQLELAIKNDKTRKKVRKLNNVIDKMSFEYSQRQSVLLDRIVPETLDSLIGEELQNNGIDLSYDVSLLSGNGDSLIWRSRGLNPIGDTGIVVQAKIFPDDIISKDDTVKITFPDTTGYFLSSMWLMLSSSAIFTLIIILAFSYTVMIIFRQKKLSEIKNDFINNMTHEFKTPIATIRLAADAISKSEVNSDAAKVNYYASIIKSENDRMNNQVENILQIAQFDRNEFVPNAESIDMDEVIKSAVVMMKLHAEQKQGKITYVPEADKHIISADRRYIPIVILNLLDNAIKYSRANPEITITTSNQNGSLIIKVKDNGIGMSAETQSKVFDKFYRVQSGDIHNVKGFGLGLSYVKAIVTAHGGTISLISESDKGSEFIISFPVTLNS